MILDIFVKVVLPLLPRINLISVIIGLRIGLSHVLHSYHCLDSGQDWCCAALPSLQAAQVLGKALA